MREFSEAFWCILMVLTGTWRSVTFSDVLWCAQPIWGVLMCSGCFERLLNVKRCLMMLRRNLSHSCRFWKVHIKFWGVLWRSGVYWHILKRSYWFWIDWKDSCTFLGILWSSEGLSNGFWGVLKHSWMLWDVWCSEVFWGIIWRYWRFRGILWHSEMLCDVLRRFFGWDVI